MKLIVSLLFIVLFLMPNTSFALYQPWKAEQAARQAYEQKLSTYSPANQKKLNDLDVLIKEINQKRTDELAMQMEAQGDIMEEYAFRNPSDSKIEKVKYWVTYAHEAVAFQAAKNYIFDLRSEKNIKSEVTPTVNQFQSDLIALRKKVLNSQGMVQDLVTK